MNAGRLVLTASLTLLAACARGDQGFAYSGTLLAPSAAVGSTIGGRVSAVLVSDGAPVSAGDVLVRFDDAQERAALESARGKLAQARAALADLVAGPRSEDLARLQALAAQQRAAYERANLSTSHQLAALRAQVRQAAGQAAEAAAAAREAQRNAQRMRSLYATGDVSQQTRDASSAREAETAAQVRSAQAAVRAARAQLANAAKATLPEDIAGALAGYRAAQEAYRSLAAGSRPEQIQQAQAAVKAAQGDVADAQARLRETVVRAPASGIVNDLNLYPGDLLAPGAAVATVDETGNPYVRIYVPQSNLNRLRKGQTVRVRSDALPGVTFSGNVEQLDSQAQFTPQNVQTESDRATLAFGVKVRVQDPQRRLHGGTTVEVALP
jgi:membrane fusion protein YbhG